VDQISPNGVYHLERRLKVGMRKTLQRARPFIGFALILVSAYLTLFLYGFLQLRRARRLVRAVEELQIGAPIPKQREAEFRNLNCKPDWGVGCHTAVSSLPFVDFFAAPRRLPPKLTLSNWWGVIARIAFDANGNVLWKGLGIDDGQYHQDIAVSILVRKDARLFNPCEIWSAAKHPGYLPYRAMRTGALVVELSPDANPVLIHRAFDVRLECLNSIRGCKTLGDIAPAAWQDSEYHPEEYQQFYQQWAASCREQSPAPRDK
jgi:hypothetical protein